MADPITLGVMGVAGAAGSIYGAIQAGNVRRRMDKFLDGMKADNEAWYNQNYYQNVLERADTQNLIRNMRQNLQRQNKINNSTAAITGATPEAQQAAKEATNNAVTDVYGNIAAMGEQRKDNVDARYQQQKSNLSQAELNMMEAQAQSYENLASGSLNTTLSGVGSLLSGGK